MRSSSPVRPLAFAPGYPAWVRFGALLIAAALLAMGSARAQVDPAALYEGEAAVPDQSEEARFEALPEALAAVIVKLTGSPEAPLEPRLRERLGEARDFVQHFRYREQAVVVDGMPERRSVLVARFDRGSVDRLLEQAGVAAWPGPRPPLMLWLGIDDGRGPRLVAEAQAQAVAALAQRAAAEGVGLIYPLMDLEDQQAVSVQVVWNEDVEALASGSARYGAQSLLSGRLERSGTGWRAQWLLVDGGEVVLRWSDTGGDAQALLSGGASGAVSALTQRYAGLGALGSPGRYAVRISGIESAADYARAMAYLGSLGLVRGIELHSASGDRLQLSVDLGAGIEALQRMTRFSQVLRPLGASPSGAAEFALEPQ